MVKKIEMVLANKRSAEYVKSLANNTVPKQRYLYQRFAEDGAIRQLNSPQKKADLLNVKSSKSMINVLEAEDSVDKIKNNLDIEFEKIDETHYMDELSPELPHLNKGVSLMHQPAVSSKLRNQVQLLNRTRTLN